MFSKKVVNCVSVRQQTPLELFDDFYEAFNGQALSEEQREILAPLIKEIWEGEV